MIVHDTLDCRVPNLKSLKSVICQNLETFRVLMTLSCQSPQPSRFSGSDVTMESSFDIDEIANKYNLPTFGVEEADQIKVDPTYVHVYM